MATSIRICMLNADYCVPVVRERRSPTYGQIFHELLAAAAHRTALNTKILSTEFDVVRAEYPPSLADFDAIVISGSANSSYDNLDWIHKLELYIRHVYETEPRIKIFGSCFGHQIMCQSLLKDYGVKVEADPNGWEIGVKNIKLNDIFRKSFGRTMEGTLRTEDVPETMRLQFVHHDHVVIPSQAALPPSWVTLGSTQHCAVQGVYEANRLLTFQGHFEFDKFVNSETVKFFFPTWAPEVLQEALDAINADDDSIVAADMVLRFFLENSAAEHPPTCGVSGSMLASSQLEQGSGMNSCPMDLGTDRGSYVKQQA